MYDDEYYYDYEYIDDNTTATTKFNDKANVAIDKKEIETKKDKSTSKPSKPEVNLPNSIQFNSI